MTVGAVTTAAGITSEADNFTTGSAIWNLTNGLVAGTTGTSYIESITVDANGKLTANAKAFPAYTATEVTKSGNDCGVYVDVTTENGQVKSVGVSADNINCSTVTANSAEFTDLTVTSTATFSATTVSATTLTVGGSTVNKIAQDEIAAVTANTITATGTSLPTQSAVATYVSAAVSNLAGAMHFRGAATITKTGETITVTNFQETFTPAGGDVVVDTANNLEAVYTGSAWELLGSNAVYALDAYAPGTESVTAGTTTLGGAVHAIAGAVDTLTTSFSNLGTAASMAYSTSVANDSTLPTGAAVTTFVGSEITTSINALNADVSSSNQTGLTVSVVETSGVITGVQAELVWLDASGVAIA